MTYTATDIHGNISTDSFDIEVTDDETPTISGMPANISQSNDAGECAADVSWAAPTAGDNCGVASFTSSHDSGDSFAVGTTTVTYSVTDIHGNSNSASFTVTVTDDEAPAISPMAADNTYQRDGGEAAAFSSWLANYGGAAATDNCGIDSWSNNSTGLSDGCGSTGTETVTFTVTDIHGNSSTTSATFTVIDDYAPSCPAIDLTDGSDTGLSNSDDITSDDTPTMHVLFTGSGVESAEAGDIVELYIDGALSQTHTVTQTDVDNGYAEFETGPFADGAVGFSALHIDDCGQSSIFAFLNIIVHSTDPTAMGAGMTITLDENGEASIEAEDLNDGSDDDFNIIDLEIDQTDFDCSHLGDNAVTLTVTDIAGNTATTTVTVTVVDDIDPVVTPMDITVQLDAAGEATITASDVASAEDNCTVASMTLDITSFDCSNVGDVMVTISATDQSGNSASATATVTVEDNVPPTVMLIDTVLYLDSDGLATLAGEDLDDGSSDACGIAGFAIGVPGTEAPAGQMLLVPGNDDCANATAVGEGTFAFDNTGASTDGPTDGDANMALDVWFLYTPSADGTASINTCGSPGSNDDTVIIVYDGSSCPSAGDIGLTSDDDGCVSPNFASAVDLAVSASNTYLIQLGGWNGAQGDGELYIELEADPSGPSDPGLTNDDCANATAVGEGTFAFDNTGASTDGPTDGDANMALDVWFLYTPSADGTATIHTCGSPGSNDDTVIIVYDGSSCPSAGDTGLASDDDGCASPNFNSTLDLEVSASNTYLIQLGGWNGVQGDGELYIELEAGPTGPTGPANDDCANATAVGEGTHAFDNTGASTDGPTDADGNMADDVWFLYTPSGDGMATIHTCGSPGTLDDTVIILYDGASCPSAGDTGLASDDDGCTSPNFNSTLDFEVSTSNTYLIQLGGWNGAQGNGELYIELAPIAPDNDECANATAVGEGTFAFDNTGANTDGPTDGDGNMANDVWFLYTPTADGTATIHTCGSPGTLDDTVIILYDGSSCPGAGNAGLASDDDGCSSPIFNSSITLEVSASNSYLIQLGGWNGAQGDGELYIDLDVPMPTLFIPEFTFDCDDTGSNLMFVEVEDVHGNAGYGMINIAVYDTTAPMVNIFDLEDYTLYAGETCVDEVDLFAAGQPWYEADDNCEQDVEILYDIINETGIAGCREFDRRWIIQSTDASGNMSSDTTLQHITVIDTTAPTLFLDGVPADLSIDLAADCTGDMPDAASVTASATDNCTDAPTLSAVTMTDSAPEYLCGDAGSYTVTRTYSATAEDACGNMGTISVEQVVTFLDVTAPQIVDSDGISNGETVTDADADDIFAFIDVPNPINLDAEDACGGDVTIVETEAFSGFVPTEEIGNYCGAATPAAFLDGDACNGDAPAAIVLEGAYFGGESFTIAEGGVNIVESFYDQTLRIEVEVTNADGTGGFIWNADYNEAYNWAEWNGLGRGYKKDCPNVLPGQSPWTGWDYFVMQTGGMIGTGIYAGSELSLTHQPMNYYYGLQVGQGANNVNAKYGASAWFFWSGQLVVNGASQGFLASSGDIMLDLDCTMPWSAEYGYTVSDACGNTTSFSYTVEGDESNAGGAYVSGEESDHQPYDISVIGDLKDPIRVTGLMPNPTNDVSQLGFVVTSNMRLRVDLYSMDGQLVQELYDGNAMTDVEYLMTIDADGLDAGMYQIRIASSTYMAVKKLLVTQ
ncbi:MAG: HYR domain-containing protein [Flavobacteriales bacterium]